MEIEKEFDVDVYDISKVISEEEMKELCEDGYGLDNVINLFTDVYNMLEEWLSFAGISNIDEVIKWLESYGYKVTE